MKTSVFALDEGERMLILGCLGVAAWRKKWDFKKRDLAHFLLAILNKLSSVTYLCKLGPVIMQTILLFPIVQGCLNVSWLVAYSKVNSIILHTKTYTPLF